MGCSPPFKQVVNALGVVDIRFHYESTVTQLPKYTAAFLDLTSSMLIGQPTAGPTQYDLGQFSSKTFETTSENLHV